MYYPVLEKIPSKLQYRFTTPVRAYNKTLQGQLNFPIELKVTLKVIVGPLNKSLWKIILHQDNLKKCFSKRVLKTCGVYSKDVCDFNTH